MTLKTKYLDLGLMDYETAWKKQQELHDKAMKAKLEKKENRDQFLIFCEHPHVYTLGKSGTYANLLIPDEFLEKINARFYRIDRGGDITYHGPGQLVGYPVFDLEELGTGIRQYIEKMENAICRLLETYGIHAGKMEAATGVWIHADAGEPARKICAIGVKVSRMISMHGFALNVNTNLDYFKYINPCGFSDKGVTSMSQLLGKSLDMNEVKQKLLVEFEKEFHLKIES